jgi:multiple sugar transport system substrate-binding protein
MSRRSLRRRSPARLKGGLGLTALAGVTVLTLAACGSSGTSSSAGAGSTPTSTSTSSLGSTTSGSIVWSASPLSGTGANDARTVLINAFEKQYPNIHVTLVSASTDTDTNRATLATQIAGGSASPDVFMGDVIWPAQFGAHQLAVPLSQYLPSSYWSKFAPGLVAGATYKGAVYGSPLFEDQGFLYYRKDLLTKDGLPVPTTWEQLESDAKAVLAKGQTKYGFVWEGDSYEGLTCDFMEYLTDAGGTATNSTYTKATLNSAAALKAVTFMRSLVTSGVTPAAVTTFQEPQAMTTFGTGNAVFLRNWDYAYESAITPADGGKLTASQVGVEPLPTFRPPATPTSAAGTCTSTRTASTWVRT